MSQIVQSVYPGAVVLLDQRWRMVLGVNIDLARRKVLATVEDGVAQTRPVDLETSIWKLWDNVANPYGFVVPLGGFVYPSASRSTPFIVVAMSIMRSSDNLPYDGRMYVCLGSDGGILVCHTGSFIVDPALRICSDFDLLCQIGLECESARRTNVWGSEGVSGGGGHPETL